MSIFDPHSLYKRRQLSSKKGQIIQKRPVEKRSAYTRDDLKKALEVIGAFPTTKIGRTLNFNCATVNSGFFVFSEVVPRDNIIYLTVNNILDNLGSDDQLWSQMNDIYDMSRGNIGPFQIVVLIRHIAYSFSLSETSPSGVPSGDYSIVHSTEFPGADYSQPINCTSEFQYIQPSPVTGGSARISFWKSGNTQLTGMYVCIRRYSSGYIGLGGYSNVSQGTLDKTGSVNYRVFTTTESTRSAFLQFLNSHEVPDEDNDRLVTVTYTNSSLPVGFTGQVRFEVAYDVIVEGSMTV